ncbi:MAG TPA: hypothetical protein VGN83_20950 [Falsiroseomonas sp.]|jgi:hypothetical protein|nr:hypothetical protein [Falsiroseomonas sp.]
MSGSTSYRVSARLHIEGDAERALRLVARALTTLDQGIVRTERNLRNLMRTLNGLGGAGADVRRASTAMDHLRTGSQGAGQAVRGATSSIQAQARALDRATQSAQNAAAAMRSLSSATPARINVSGAGRRGGYDSRLGEGVVAGAAGRSALQGVGGSLMAGGDVQHQSTMLAAGGVSAADRARAEMRASEMVREVRGTTVADNLQLIGQLRTTFASLDEAMQFAPDFARISQTLAAVTGREPGRAGSYAARFLDAIDAFVNPETGRIDPARGISQARMMERAIIMNQGTIGPEQFLNFQQRARVAGRRLDPEVLYGMMPALMESMGSGHTTGTELAAFYRQMIGGQMTQRIAQEMMRYGLVNQRDVEVRRGGHVVVRPGSVAQSDLLARNPIEWIRTVLQPAMVAQGASTQDQQLERIATLFGTETGRGFVSQIIAGMPQLTRNLEAFRSTPENAGEILANEGWRTALRNLTAGFTNLMSALGSSVMDEAISVMNSLSNGMNYMAAVIRQNPGVGEALVVLTGAIGGLMVVIAGFAAAGLVMSGLTALTGGLGAAGLAGALFVIAPYVGILAGVGVGLKALYDAVPGDSLAEKINNAAAAMRNLMDAVTGFFDRIQAAWQRGAEARQRLDEEGPANQAPGGVHRRFNRRGEGGGYYEGPAVVPQSFNPAPPGGGALQPIVLINQLDGREISRATLPHMGRTLNALPPHGPAHYVRRI